MSTLRITGLASGFDYETMITKLMDAQRIPLDKLNQKKQINQWTQEDYRTLNTKILDFKNAAFDMKLQGSYLSKSATSSNESVLSVTGTVNAIEGQYRIKVDQLASAANLTSSQLTGTDQKIANGGTLTIKGSKGSAEVTITAGQSYTEIAANINAASITTGVKVSYDSTLKSLFFSSTKSGADASIELSDSNTDQSLLNALGFTATGTNSDGDPSLKVNGNNAIVYFNDIKGEYDSNTFTVAGVNVTVKQKSATEEKINVSQNVEEVYNKIKSFVDKYNDLIASINSKLSEERDRDYTPLTDAQRKEMDDKQIEQWEAKAKSGLLARDSLLTNDLFSMRQALSTSISGLATGQLKFLSDIGISSTLLSGSTVSGSYLDKGKLFIDESKLKQMITDKPDEVMALFIKNDENSSSGDGFATRLYDQASAMFSQIVEKAGASTSTKDSFTLGKETVDLDKQIARLQARLTDMEDRYYAQFTRMETYINQMNSQSSSLASMFSTGG